jgi:copper(I)-binding protein
MKFTILGLMILLLLAACGGESAETTPENSAASGTLTVDTVTANLTLPTPTGAVYMRITNGTTQDDALVGAAVPGCGVVELHEMMMDGDVMRMRPVDGQRIPIPAGQTVMLERGGLHVMCLEKTGTYTVGDTVPVTLQFANAGTIEVNAEVIAPGEMNGEMSGEMNGDMGGEE